LFFKHSSSAACEHFEPMSGDEKTLCINSFGDKLEPEPRLIILQFDFSIFYLISQGEEKKQKNISKKSYSCYL
jgi:hypothetical protein